MDSVSQWREFERLLTARGLGWSLRYVPAHLRYAVGYGHERGVRLDHLLPGDYRRFVTEVGYPTLFYGEDSRAGFAFLPPEAMAAQSVDQPVWDGSDYAFPTSVPDAPTTCLHAFFAGFDFPEYNGWSLGPDGDDLVVWTVEDGGPVAPVGTFTAWLGEQIADHERDIAELDEAAVAELKELHADPDGRAKLASNEWDPYRVLERSLGGSYTEPPFSPADLELRWVRNAESGEHGLVDRAGGWLIPMGSRFREVRPFRDGTAQVRLRDAGPTAWTTIRPDGSTVHP